MEIELVEIRDFIAQYHPFELLEEELLNGLTENVEIRYIRRGKCFPPKGNTQHYVYIIRTGAIELRDTENQMINKIAEGDIYTSSCQLLKLNESSCHMALEDSLIYQFPCTYLETLFEKSIEFKHHFEDDLTQRLQRATKLDSREVDVGVASMTVEVGSLIHKAPITMDVSASIQEAAQMMSEFNVSSIMLTKHDKLTGILTDRDLRRRCVAKGLDVSQAVTKIMSSHIISMPSDTLVLHALMLMTRSNINHLPIIDDDVIIGMLTATDLTRHSSANPAFITSQIHKAHTLEELSSYTAKLPALQLLLSDANISARHVGETISCITDSLTIKLIEMAQDEIGPEPVPFVWVAGGSQARLEQSSHSDQDNAMILSNDVTSKDMPYFHELAKRVCDGLNACGFIYCPGNAMAINKKWCQPYKVWKGYFNDWINKPEPMALMLSSIFFDLRAVFGDYSLHKKLHKKMLGMTAKNSLFIAHMVSNALKHRPPVGFFRTFVLIQDGKHDNTFDIKHRGIVPITDVARVLALAEGIKKVNTTERLIALGATKSLSTEMVQNLIVALEFIANIRVRHQAGQIRKGKEPDNFLPPDSLSSLERKHLKDSFEIIKDIQDTLERRYMLA